MLIFALIEAKRMKNQLFNYYWAQQVRSEGSGNKPAPEKLGPLFRLETPARKAPRGRPRRCRAQAALPRARFFPARQGRKIDTPAPV